MKTKNLKLSEFHTKKKEKLKKNWLNCKEKQFKKIYILLILK